MKELLAFLRNNDPASDISAARLDAIQNGIFSRLGPQDRPSPRRKPERFLSGPRLALGGVVLLSGLFAGRAMDTATALRQTTRLDAEQSVFVLAAAEPWGNFVTEEGE